MNASGDRLAGAAVAVAALTLIGNLLGFLRDVVIAYLYGASAQTDAFFVAWTVPETFSPLLIEGAIPLLLIPWLVRRSRTATGFAAAVTSAGLPLLLMATILTLALVPLSDLVVAAIAPALPEQELAGQCLRLAIGTIPAMTLAGVMGAALRSAGALIVPAFVYAGYNVGILATMFALSDQLGVRAAAVGLTVGAVTMVAVQLPTYLRRVGLSRPSRMPMRATRIALTIAAPTLAYLLLRQGQVFVERHVGSFLGEGSIAALNLSQKLGQVPVTIAMALCLVSFPTISRLAQHGDTKAVGRLFSSIISSTWTVLAPATLILLLCAHQLVTITLGRGSFTPEAVDITAAALQWYVLGIIAQGVVNATALTIFAMKRSSWRPAVWLLTCLIVTAVVAQAAAPRYAATGIAAANAGGIIVGAAGMLLFLRRRGIWRFDLVRGPMLRATLCCLVAAVLSQVALMSLSMGPWVEFLMVTAIFGTVYGIVIAARAPGGLRDMVERGGI